MAQYMLLLHENPADFTQLSPEEMQKVFSEYGAWRNKIQAAGSYVGGNKLKDEGGKHLTGGNGGQLRVTDGPFAEAKEVIGGYFAISAADYNEAVEISKGCPHLKFGGRIELREIEQMG